MPDASSPDSSEVQVHRGLQGVYFDRSEVCDIDGRAGELRYRGYSIHDLAQHSTFEEASYLLFNGDLPIRLFEGAGMGCAVLADHMEDLREISPSSPTAEYSSVADAIEAAKFLQSQRVLKQYY